MNNFRNRFANFMRGRNGVDYFSRFLLWAAFILILLSLIPHLWFLDYIGLALIIYSYFRIFSHNIAKRSAENRRYLGFRERFISWWWEIRNRFRGLGGRAKEARKYHIYVCPNCSQKIRIPRGKGKIIVRCPKCGTEFQKRS